ncbi:MAG TPA: hypothetical protein VFY92_08145 [Hyphomicrobiaceae bacterium]|nr:hypothetical protein [Hyphomicrobiaceae bacterium]
MFAGLVNEAKAAASGLVLKYVTRASVAVPFAIAIGFALAATTVTLVQWFGQATAYWIMAAGLAVIGLIAAAAVSIREEQEEKAEALAEQTDTQDVVSEATAQAMGQVPFALLGALATAPGGATTLLPVLRLLARNLPLVLLLVIIGTLLWPSGAAQSEQSAGDTEAGGAEEAADDLGPPVPLRPAHERV